MSIYRNPIAELKDIGLKYKCLSELESWIWDWVRYISRDLHFSQFELDQSKDPKYMVYWKTENAKQELARSLVALAIDEMFLNRIPMENTIRLECFYLAKKLRND